MQVYIYLLLKGNHNKDVVKNYLGSDDINYDSSGMIHGSDQATKLFESDNIADKMKKFETNYFGVEAYKMFMKNNQSKTCSSF